MPVDVIGYLALESTYTFLYISTNYLDLSNRSGFLNSRLCLKVLSYRLSLKIMDDFAETIVAQATDPKVAFMAAAVFGYCLYKLTMAKRKSPQTFTEDSDETDDDVVI